MPPTWSDPGAARQTPNFFPQTRDFSVWGMDGGFSPLLQEGTETMGKARYALHRWVPGLGSGGRVCQKCAPSALPLATESMTAEELILFPCSLFRWGVCQCPLCRQHLKLSGLRITTGRALLRGTASSAGFERAVHAALLPRRAQNHGGGSSPHHSFWFSKF